MWERKGYSVIRELPIRLEQKQILDRPAFWQIDVGFDGDDFHAIGTTPFEALRELTNYWERRSAPLYWKKENDEMLESVIRAYLKGEELAFDQMMVMKIYLRQWIMSPIWGGKGVDELRKRVDDLQHRYMVEDWLKKAYALKIDPV